MNKVVLITGGARRIGAETAKYLHSKGMNILITYSKSASAARALRKSLNSKRDKSCEIYKVEFKSWVDEHKDTLESLGIIAPNISAPWLPPKTKIENFPSFLFL